MADRPPRPELEPGCECAYVWEKMYGRWVLLINSLCPLHAKDSRQEN